MVRDSAAAPGHEKTALIQIRGRTMRGTEAQQTTKPMVPEQGLGLEPIIIIIINIIISRVRLRLVAGRGWARA